MKKRIYDFRGFSGPDVSLEISLSEYGIAWKWNKKDKDYTIVYGVNFDQSGDFYRFAFTCMSFKDFQDLITEQWFNTVKVADFMGGDDFLFASEDNFTDYLQGFISYHGTENILGSCYHEGFEITGLGE